MFHARAVKCLSRNGFYLSGSGGFQYVFRITFTDSRTYFTAILLYADAIEEAAAEEMREAARFSIKMTEDESPFGKQRWPIEAAVSGDFPRAR